MFTSENHVGRLVELRFEWPLTPEQIAEGIRIHHQNIDALVRRSIKAVVVSDFRRSQVFPSEIAEKLITLAADVTDQLERSAFLLPESAIFGLQAERAIQTAGSHHRRLFREMDEAIEWLGELLEPAEKRRLRVFIRSNPPLGR